MLILNATYFSKLLYKQPIKMQSENDFLELYRKYPDEELTEAYINIEGYSADAKIAIYTIIKEKGGIERLLQSLKDKLLIEKEILRIKNETQQLSGNETDAAFIKTLLSSTVIPQSQVDDIIDESFESFSNQLKANSIDSKTILFA